MLRRVLRRSDQPLNHHVVNGEVLLANNHKHFY
jgi:hypothetical protein